MSQLSAAKSSTVIALQQSLRVDHTQCRVILTDEQIAYWRENAQENGNEVRVFIGQERAKHALEFGLGMPVKGYNLYVMGEQATGRATLVKDYVAKHAISTELYDWVYVNNVKSERSPKAIKMPAAQSEAFYKDMQGLVNQLLDMFPAAFDNPGYQRKKSATQKHHQSQYENALETVEKQAQAHNIAMFEEEGMVSFMPIVEGKAIKEETFATLDEGQQSYF